MSVARYTIGPPTRPAIQHDNGFLDKFLPRKPTSADFARRAVWLAKLEGVEALQCLPLFPHNDLPDALAAYRHFLAGNGKDRMISYERYVSNDESGKKTLASAILDAQQGAEFIHISMYRGQSPVDFQMTGSAISVGGNYPAFPYPATENWQKALGAHVIWLSANVQVSAQRGMFHFNMSMILHAEDRYNFNPGAKDIATGIPDSENGVFELTGLAQQYRNYGALYRTVSWSGTTKDHAVVNRPDTGRDRKPSDNRRSRNRY